MLCRPHCSSKARPSTLVGHLVSQQDGGLADPSTPAVGGLLSSSDAGSFQKAESFSTLPGIIGRLVRSGVDVPLFRNGGQREAGYVMWCLAHIADCLIQQDIQGAQEFLALTLVAVDQSVIDHGRWDFAWILTLLEDPPAQLFHARPYSSNPRSRAFSPLSPVVWST